MAQSHIAIFPVKWLIRDRYPSDKYLGNYHGKVAIAVDGKDRTVPERFGRRLFDAYNGPKRLWTFPNGGHIQIERPQVFWREVIEFWRMPQASLAQDHRLYIPFVDRASQSNVVVSASDLENGSPCTSACSAGENRLVLVRTLS